MAYITLNNFQVAEDQAEGFEQRWRQRRSRLQDVPGFESFRLLRGEPSDGAVHYASHTTWACREDFEAWMHSDHFVQVHRGDPLTKGKGIRLYCHKEGHTEAGMVGEIEIFGPPPFSN